MKVLFQSRPDLFNHPGGDTIQLTETRAALTESGVDVSLDLAGRLNPTDYDLVHVFNLNRIDRTGPLVARAARRGVPVAISPIYWSKAEFILRGIEANLLKRVADLASRVFPLGRPLLISSRDKVIGLTTEEFSSSPRWGTEMADQASTLRVANGVLPNSRAEAAHLRNRFDVDLQKIFVIPNGARTEISSARREEFLSRYGKTEYVLSCARIEDRKNTLRLIRACVRLNLPLVLVGRSPETPFTQKYLQKCRNEARKGQVTFLGELEYGSELHFSAYACARVHALVSWYETPGLASIEAAAAGCNIVSTNRGSAHEYFGDLAWYCSPANEKSIRDAISSAFESPRSTLLQEKVLREFTWRSAAERTIESYSRIVRSRALQRERPRDPSAAPTEGEPKRRKLH